MVDVTDLNGVVMHVSDDSIDMIMGPYPQDPPNRSHIIGPAATAIATNEVAASLVARLRPKTPLAELTRPNDTPVWVKGAAVTVARPPMIGETPPGEVVGSVIYLGTRHQAIKEDVPIARRIINQHGGNI